MAGSLDWRTDLLDCPHCGEESEVRLVIDTGRDGIPHTDIAGRQKCECGHVFTAEDIK